jgi:replicative DNA helicase
MDTIEDVIGAPIAGRFYVFGARPSNGKTSWFFSWIHRMRLAEGGNLPRVLGVWTERSAVMAYQTSAAMILGYSIEAVLNGEWDRLPSGAREMVLQETESEQRMAHLRCWYTDMTSPTVTDLQTWIDRVDPEVVIVDYIQRIRADRGTKRDAVIAAVDYLQQEALHNGRIVVIGSQNKRRGDGVWDKYRPPHMEDSKLAGEIEEAADVLVGLFRPLQMMTRKDQKAVDEGRIGLENFTNPGVMAVKVLKHRYRAAAADRVLWVECVDGFVRDRRAVVPVGAGDAWEDRTPF